MGYRIGIDVGGTFTDAVLWDETAGRLYPLKVPSTPDDPSQGIQDALEAFGAPLAQVTVLAHGTTVATNAILQRIGAPTALITTEGFADLLAIGRQKRPHLYDMTLPKPEPLVPANLRWEVAERLLADGSVRRLLDRGEVERHLHRLRAAGVEALAVCLLHSYRNPAHELQVEAIARELAPDVFCSLSHTVSGEWREYERLSTTVLNSYLGPVLSRYMQRFGERTARLGIRVKPQVTQSNGGVISLQEAARFPVRTVLSGPAAGVTGSHFVATAAGHADVITFDMGGTSTDVCLIRSGEPASSAERVLEGYPIRLPMLDVHTIGAGGGSIARLDIGGALRVGPASAGASPGPACYGRGGEHPTVTDANVVLGRLATTGLAGGQIRLDPDAAARAIQREVAQPGGMTVPDAAAGIVEVVVSNMVRAIREVSVNLGEDPADCALLAYGGAGPLHAVDVARAVGMHRVIVPAGPGVLCALGLLASDLRADYARTVLLPGEPSSAPALEVAFTELEAKAEAWLGQEGVPAAARRVSRLVDARYRGQNFELTVPAGDLAQAVLAFRELHQHLYGHGGDRAVDIVTVRVRAVGERSSPPAMGIAGNGSGIRGRRRVHFAGEGYVDTPVLPRAAVGPGVTLNGPAVVEQMDTTVLIPPAAQATGDDQGNLVISL